MKWGPIPVARTVILPFLLHSVRGGMEMVTSGSRCSVQGMQTVTNGRPLLSAWGSLSNGDCVAPNHLQQVALFLVSFFSLILLHPYSINTYSPNARDQLLSSKKLIIE